MVSTKQTINETEAEASLRQAEIIMALSLATDLGTGRPMEWAMRSALLGVRLGEALRMGEQELREVYYCTLLLYIGCTSQIELGPRLFGDDPAAAIASVDFVDQGNPQEMMAWMEANVGLGANRCGGVFLCRTDDFSSRYGCLGCGRLYVPGRSGRARDGFPGAVYRRV